MQKKSRSRAIYLAFGVIKKFNDWLERYRIRVYAAQASFFMTISAIPFLMIVLSLLGLFLPKNGETVKELLLNALPSEFSSAAETVLAEVSEKSSIKLLSVGALTLFWSASRGIGSIGAGVGNVFERKNRDGFFLRYAKALGFTLIWIITVALTLGIWVFGDTIISYSEDLEVTYLFRIMNSGALLVLLSVVFSLTYMSYSGRESGFFENLPGAVFSAAGWFVFSRFFEFYIENYANYSFIYGSLTAIIVVMLWLYFCMEILLIGAGINSLRK